MYPSSGVGVEAWAKNISSAPYQSWENKAGPGKGRLESLVSQGATKSGEYGARCENLQLLGYWEGDGWELCHPSNGDGAMWVAAAKLVMKPSLCINTRIGVG